MKTAVIGAPSRIDIVDGQRPELKPGEILVQMKACGICGSDIEKVFGHYGKTSTKLGHEPAGVVMAVGGGVTKYAPGDRVFTHHHVPCYDCHLCRHGCETLCPRYCQTNLSPCGLSQEYVVPEWNVSHGGVLKLPDNVTFEQAALIEPLACCIRAWSRIPYQKGDSVAVFGAGPTGIMHAMLAETYGMSKIFCLDINEFRLDFAKKMGAIPVRPADLGGAEPGARPVHDVDVSIIATSSLKALHDAVSVTRDGGTIMFFGVPASSQTISLDMSVFYSKELRLLTSYAASDADTAAALDLIASGSLDMSRIITHRYDIAESQKAFEHARTADDAMKIIITS